MSTRLFYYNSAVTLHFYDVNCNADSTTNLHPFPIPFPRVSKELLATAGDNSLCLVFQKLLLYREVKRSTHNKGSKFCIVTVAVNATDYF